MTEMIERVAKVLAEREGSGPWEGGMLGDRGREMWRKTARAAIEAMREPTEVMMDAGLAADSEVPLGAIEAVYRAMIGAALQ